ncbi:MAG: cytochrome C oxidase subunit I [Bacteroidota bacterium]|nr:cytochrome C oxidase subunit I [Bacteroidota bacterium]
MINAPSNTGLQQTTSYKVVLPFYIYAAISFLTACILLLLNTRAMHQHYFLPQTLAITHIMALGWGTMIILGASHQLLPAMIDGKLSSNTMAYLSFGFAAVGIPILATGFYLFQTGWLLQAGALLVNAAMVCYLVNVVSSIYETKKTGVHAVFIATAALWLFATTFFGLLLVFNFTRAWLPRNSVDYLSLHAHMGITGWFLLLVLGVASRLIPMFLISKYSSRKRLWWIYALINLGLLVFILLKLFVKPGLVFYVPVLLIGAALAGFADYCRRAYKVRLRKQVDEQLTLSLLSVALLLLPVLCLLVTMAFMSKNQQAHIVVLYGFCIFFGWITAMILGMTFKTLPFIVWNKVYHDRAAKGKTPAPKELFSEKLFRQMKVFYLSGFGLFITGLVFLNDILLISGAAALVLAALSYAGNVARIILHKRVSL